MYNTGKLSRLILKPLLHRDATQRLTSSDLIRRLEQCFSVGETSGAYTIDPGTVVQEQSVVLHGT